MYNPISLLTSYCMVDLFSIQTHDIMCKVNNVIVTEDNEPMHAVEVIGNDSILQNTEI